MLCTHLAKHSRKAGGSMAEKKMRELMESDTIRCVGPAGTGLGDGYGAFGRVELRSNSSGHDGVGGWT